MDEASYYEKPELWGSEDRASRPSERERLRETLQLVPDDTRSLLDVGVGDGRFLDAVAAARSGIFLVGLDRSMAALRHVTSRPVRASSSALPFRAGAFDAVAAMEVLEHLPTEILRRSILEIARVTSRYVLVTVPNNEDLRRASLVCPECACRFHRNRHLRSFDTDALIDLIPNFDLVKRQEVGPAVAETPRVLLEFARRIGRLPPKPWGTASCPQCGLSKQVDAQGSGGPDVAPFRFSRLIPRRTKKMWLAAVYRRRH